MRESVLMKALKEGVSDDVYSMLKEGISYAAISGHACGSPFSDSEKRKF